MKKLMMSIICILSLGTLFGVSNKDWEIINPSTECLKGYVHTLEYDNDLLYIGGDFIEVDSTVRNNIVAWDGVDWLSLEKGASNWVEALVVDSAHNLYAGGSFARMNDRYVHYIAKWDGSTWSSIGDMNGPVTCLAMDKENDYLYVGGWFTRAGNVSANCVARWDGKEWSSLGAGMSGTDYEVVFALEVDNDGNLLAGGIFNKADTVSAKNIAKWDGTTWSPLAGGLPHVMTIAVDSKGTIYAGGEFKSGSKNNIAKFDGGGWSSLGNGMKKPVYDIEIDEYDNLYAGSYTSNEEGVRLIGKWDGNIWSPIGTGVNKGIIGMDYCDGRLYVGGCFTRAGGMDAPYLASVIVNPSNVSLTSGSDFIIDPSRGSTDQVIGRFMLSVDKVIGHVSEANISITGIRDGLSNFKLWESSDNVFDPLSDTQLDTIITDDPGIGNVLTFSNFSSLIQSAGTYYFLTCDIASTASGTFKAEIVNDNALIVCGGEFPVAFEYEPLSQNAVSYPADLSISFQDSLNSISLNYGWSGDACVDYDAGLDEYAPETAQENTLDARFRTGGSEYISDYRKSITTGEYITWELYLQKDTSHEATMLSWDPSLFPAQGIFMLQDSSEQININMRETNHMFCYASEMKLQIIYTLFLSDFKADIISGDLPLTVQFTDHSYGDINSWYWDFGDGNTSTEQSPVHIYDRKGDYTVSLTVRDGSNTDVNIRQDLIQVDHAEYAYITGIRDVADDQGGWAYIDFLPSKHDTGIPGETTIAHYIVERQDQSTWIALDTLEANVLTSYTSTVQTPIDSSRFSSGALDYRVLALSNDSTYTGNIFAGYSLDNIPPSAPTRLDMAYISNDIHLDWDAVSDPDLQYYGIYRSIDYDFHAIVPEIYTYTTETSFIDSILIEGKNYYYRIVAIDIHENESGPTETVGQYTLIDPLAGIPNDYSLRQNYPNPFNPTTSINFQLPENTQVELTIYDMSGRRIDTLVRDHMPAGSYTITWDASGYSTGIYFCRLTAGDFVETRKMILMK